MIEKRPYNLTPKGRESLIQHNSGLSNPNWKGGISSYVSNRLSWAKRMADKGKREKERINVFKYHRNTGVEYSRARTISYNTTNKPPCAICGERRVIDLCHIVSLRDGGDSKSDNLMWLCPTCHRLFDQNKLNEEERNVIIERVKLAKDRFNISEKKDINLQVCISGI